MVLGERKFPSFDEFCHSTEWLSFMGIDKRAINAVERAAKVFKDMEVSLPKHEVLTRLFYDVIKVEYKTGDPAVRSCAHKVSETLAFLYAISSVWKKEQEQ